MDGKKIKGGAEKVREKKKQKLLSEASTCYSLETLFTKMTKKEFASPMTKTSNLSDCSEENIPSKKKELASPMTKTSNLSDCSEENIPSKKKELASPMTKTPNLSDCSEENIPSKVKNDIGKVTESTKLPELFMINLFEKPTPQNINQYFLNHPKQPYSNISFNPLIAYIRKERKENFKREWLSYSEDRHKFYCTFCIVFGKDENRFTLGCDSKIENNPYERIREHENSLNHCHATESFILHSNSKDIFNHFKKGKQIEVEKNRLILHRVIDVMKLIGKRGLSYRGSRNGEAAYTLNNDNVDHGNFLEMLLLIAKFDPILKRHIDEIVMKSNKQRGRGNLVTLVSKSTADYIIDSIGDLMKKSILEEISKAEFFSIQIDSTQDINVHDQLCVIIRFISDSSIKERLIAMVNSKIGTGQGLCNTVCKVISDFGLDVNKCIGSSTDGASNMRGEYNGFNAWLSKEAPQQVHVWCYAHILNLIMTDTTKVCIESISLFGLLNSCAVFVRESYVRMAKWEEKSKYRFISVIGETRWWSKDKCLSKMFGIFGNPESSLYVDVIDTFHDIYTSDKFSIEIRHKSKCYLDSLLQYKTIATAHIFLRIFISTTPLSLYLQTKGMNFIQAFSMVKETIQTLQSQRRNLEPVLEATNNFINWANNEFHERKFNYKIEKYTKVGRQSKIKKKRIFDEVTEDEAIYDQNERFKIDVFNVIYDQILTSLIDRFEKHEDLFREISYFDPNSFELIKNLKYHDLDFLGKRLQKYDPQFNPGDLLAELLDFSSKWDSIKRLADNLHNSVSYEDISEIMPNQILSDHDSPLESACKDCIICCFKVLHQYQLHMSAYKNLYLAYKYILSLSCTQVSCERTFSKLKYILNRLRCMMSQEKLEHFLLLSVEKDILCNVKNDDVIDLIAQKSNLLKQILTVQ